MVYTLQNNELKMVFDDCQEGFISIYNLAAGEEIIKKNVRTPLCEIVGLPYGSQEKVEFYPGRLSGVELTENLKTKNLVIHYDTIKSPIAGEKNTRLTIQVALDEQAPESIWSLDIENQTDNYDIVEVIFPYVRGICLGDDWQDDTIIYPHHAGEKTIAPIKEYVSERYLGFNRAGTRKHAETWRREINYCGLASMLWMYYYDPNIGIYFGSHDPEFRLTGLLTETGGEESGWFGMGMRKHQRITPGSIWHSAPYVLSVVPEDWHWGARRYRQWFDQHIQIQPNPAFLADEGTLTKCYSLKREGQVIHTYDKLPDLYQGGNTTFGSRHMFIASWNRGGFDRDYPEYQPDMDLGGPMELRNACQRIIDSGGHITFYINARIFDTSSLYYKTLGLPWAIKNERGDTMIEDYGSGRTFSVTCPADAGWQKHLIDTACWMVSVFGAKGIYLDQLGSAEPFPCYDSNHTHQDLGDFNQGYVDLLKQLREQLQAIDPDSYLMIENCGDIYSQYIWGNLVWNGDPYDEFFNLYKYTFPEHVIVHMVNPFVYIEPSARKIRFYKDMERASLLGAIFWLGLEKFGPDDDGLLSYAKKVVPFRHKLTPYLKEARYVDTDGIREISPWINVSRWSLSNGDQLYIMGNIEEKSGGSFFVDYPVVEKGQLITWNIEDKVEEILVENMNNGLLVHVPNHTLSALLIKQTKA